MSDTKTISLFLVILALFGLWLDAKGKLVPFLDTLTTSTSTITNGSVTSTSLGSIAIAFVVYLLVISFLDSQETWLLTGLIVLGALIVDVKNHGANASVYQITSYINGLQPKTS